MDALNMTYRQYHEHYVSNHSGCSSWEVLELISIFPILAYYVCSLKHLLSIPKGEKILLSFVIEFSLLIVPLVFGYTVLNSYFLVYMLVLLMGLLILLVIVIHHLTKFPKKLINTAFSLITPVDQRPYLTYFRAAINLTSAFCILAVDFKIFPRRYAKTETFGFSLMDTGVAFYIVSNGLVVKPSSEGSTFVKSLVSSIPVLILGVIRYLSLENIDYQRHTTEYGRDWNFFFTLAFVKILSSFLLSKWPKNIWIPLLIALSHQSLLLCGLQSWVLGDSPRTNLLAANREGIVSLPGYISLYLTAVFIGSYLNVKTVHLKSDIKYAFKLLSWALIFSVMTWCFYTKLNISRRLVNITYITWMLALCFAMLAISLAVEVLLRVTFFILDLKDKEFLNVDLLAAINYNGLTYFLIANALTGFVNLTFETLRLNTLNSLLLLTLYMYILCSLMGILYYYKMKIKFW